MVVPVRSRPTGNQAYPCPKCGQLVSPEQHVCFRCTDKQRARKELLIRKAGEGGTPFYILAAIVALITLFLVLG